MYIEKEDFMKAHGLKRITGYDSSVHNIMIAKRCMNANNYVFEIGKDIILNGRTCYMLALLSDDNSEYVKAIVRVNSDKAKVVSLERAIGLDSELLEYTKVLEYYDFLHEGDYIYVKGAFCVEFDLESCSVSVWRESKNSENYLLLKDDITLKQLNYLFEYIDSMNVWDRRSNKIAD